MVIDSDGKELLDCPMRSTQCQTQSILYNMSDKVLQQIHLILTTILQDWLIIPFPYYKFGTLWARDEMIY